MQSVSNAHKRSQRLWDCPCYATPPRLWSTLAGELSAQGIQNRAPNVLSALVIVTALLEFPLQGLDYQEELAVWDAVDFKRVLVLRWIRAWAHTWSFQDLVLLFLQKMVCIILFWVFFCWGGERGEIKKYSWGTVWKKYQQHVACISSCLQASL